MKIPPIFIFAALFCCHMSFGQIRFNELSAFPTYPLGSEEPSDWLEVYNNGTDVINLEGYTVSDNPDNPSKWTFPSTFLQAGSYLVVLANDEDNSETWFIGEDQYLHTNFKLSSQGETLILSNPNGDIIDQVTYPILRSEHSFGRETDTSENWCIHISPSPNSVNQLSSTSCASVYLDPPTVNQAAGYYDAPLDVTLSCPSGVARYTLDGSTPNSENNTATTVTLDSTQVLSVACFSNDALTSQDKHFTYIIDEASVSMPVLSISTAPENLWDEEIGIYVFGSSFYYSDFPYMQANFWQPWERESVLEYFDADQTRVFDLPMALEIHGGWSRAEAQKGFRVDTKNELGGNIDYPLFREKSEITKFNNFNLRNGGQHAFGTRYQDAFVSRLISKKTDLDVMAYEPVTVYLNGEYWGLYGQREKMDEHFIESNHGVDSEDIDLISRVAALAGFTDHFLETLEFAEQNDPSTDEYFDFLFERIELANYIDYYATQIHIQNEDWGGISWGINNTKCWRPQSEEGKWRYMFFDADGALGSFDGVINDNYLDLARSPFEPNIHSRMFDAIMESEKFNHQFINRYADLTNTIFKPEYYNPISNEIRAELEFDIQKQIERWALPVDYSTWEYRIDEMTTYLDDRLATAREHILSHFELSAQRSFDLVVEPFGAGRIQINTIEADSNPWNGIYFQGVPVTITAIPNPGFTFDFWDPNALINDNGLQTITVDPTSDNTFLAHFIGSAEEAQVLVSEINYHSPSDNDAGDWIELYNGSNLEIDVSNWKFQDSKFYNTFTLPLGTRIPSNGFLVIAGDAEKFESVHTEVENLISGFEFNLNNDGENISLSNQLGETQLQFTYNDASPWISSADGSGYTLELVSPDADPNNASSWEGVCFLGSPGTGFDSSPCLFSALADLSNEVLSVYPNPARDEISINCDASITGIYSITLENERGLQSQLGTQFIENSTNIPLPKLPVGFYLLTLQSSDQKLTTKLVIE